MNASPEAVIYLNVAYIHPVIGNMWHRAEFLAVPLPGQFLAMLCGKTATATFEDYHERGKRAPLVECPHCNVEYRRARGIPILPEHPGLAKLTRQQQPPLKRRS
ncbi:hypothetical protein G3I59_02955 [Amycolatopsis rubida]|uniref:Uncharacterized protein n=1 Tax=Amycolatopsis rubida TaxID=112413 RepID=A0ABX0BHK8_9PSEU|nr:MULTISPECIES: hypothetical protein [Amycolatopsis]MYW89609.1 hypothetical protein [Amycolatopsis rubida]NEC54586.1 hypothetical protein [Amycolatopsis rubida]OAP25663.1 hypothetical protein A4R44_03037 [Amycolatopsis sp. M39]